MHSIWHSNSMVRLNPWLNFRFPKVPNSKTNYHSRKTINWNLKLETKITLPFQRSFTQQKATSLRSYHTHNPLKRNKSNNNPSFPTTNYIPKETKIPERQSPISPFPFPAFLGNIVWWILGKTPPLAIVTDPNSLLNSLLVPHSKLNMP